MSRYIDAIPFAKAVSDLRNKEREEYDNLVGKHRSLARSIHGQHVEFCEKMLKAIREQPTVDAVPIPCKLGDTVYYCRFDKKGYGWITPCIVTGIHITCTRNRSGQQEDYLVVKIPPCMLSAHLRIKELGTRLFLTKEEANETIKAHGERKDDGQ